MEKKNTVVALVAILATLGSLAYLYFTQLAAPKVNVTPFESLGFAVAGETAKLLNEHGKIVVVAELIEVMKSPNLEAQVRGFKAGLAKHPGVTFKGLKEIKRPPSDDPRFWPQTQAAELAGAGTGADATVWFGSLPQELSKSDVAALKENKTKLVVVSAQAPILKPLLQQGLIHLAIVNRYPPQPAPTGKETPRQWFDRVYLVVKPDALGELR